MNYRLTPTIGACPVCQSRKGHVLYSISSEEAAQHFVLREVDLQRFTELRLHIESLWQQSTCEVIRCDNCEFCYSNPYVAGDEKFYALAYRTSKSSYPAWKWEYQLTYETLMKKGTVGFRMLEVGAGIGSFVKRITPSLTHKENVLCTEYSDYGVKEIRKYGISCLATDIRALDSEKYEGYFDIVCMFQVLEHMDCLDTLFQKLNWLMRRNACLFFAVPEPRHVEFHELHGALLDMPPNHVGRWSRKCFEIIADRYRWKVERYEIDATSNFISRAKTFGIYRYLRVRQERGTLPNRIEQIQNHYVHRLMQIVGVSICMARSLPAYRALMSNNLGENQWIYLRKI